MKISKDRQYLIDLDAYVRHSLELNVKPETILFHVAHDLGGIVGQGGNYWTPRTAGYAASIAKSKAGAL